MANGPPFATLNQFAADLGIPSESQSLRIGITQQPRQGRDADFPRVPAQVLAVECEQVEAEEEDGARAASA